MACPKIIGFYMEHNLQKSFVMAERLKQLRESKGLSLEKLSKTLLEQYGIKISSDSLMNYEVADPYHTKAYKNQGMRVEYLRCLADFYGVSADYILGHIDDPCRAPSAIDELGLSPQAVEWLIDLKNQSTQDENLSHLFSNLLENLLFQQLIYELMEYRSCVKVEQTAEAIQSSIPTGTNHRLSVRERNMLNALMVGYSATETSALFEIINGQNSYPLSELCAGRTNRLLGRLLDDIEAEVVNSFTTAITEAMIHGGGVEDGTYREDPE